MNSITVVYFILPVTQIIQILISLISVTRSISLHEIEFNLWVCFTLCNNTIDIEINRFEASSRPIQVIFENGQA